MSKIHVFVSFDTEHDGELYGLLVAQSRTPSSGFSVFGSSERVPSTDTCRESVRRRIREADQMIVICGEHTAASTRVSAELRIAQEEHTPYLLLWGRRESMCSKPIGAKPAEGMYSWTLQILQHEMTRTFRKACAQATAGSFANAALKGRSRPITKPVLCT